MFRLQTYFRENREWTVPLTAGLVSGVAIAGGFNPWDRALYLSVRDKAPFLHRGNWGSPYQGFSAAVVQRTLSGSGWFVFNDWILGQLVRMRTGEEPPQVPSELRAAATAGETFLAANLAGALNGFLLNPISVVKYHQWGLDEAAQKGYFASAKALVAERGGSFRPLIRALETTIARDVVFGAVFATTRGALAKPLADVVDPLVGGPGTASFMASMIAAALATVCSSPLNYVRNVKYASSNAVRSPSILSVLSAFANELRSVDSPLRHVIARFHIGWGTARVAVGMAVGWELYDLCKAVVLRFVDQDQDDDV